MSAAKYEAQVVATLVESERSEARNARGAIQFRCVGNGNYPRSEAERDRDSLQGINLKACFGVYTRDI